MHTHSGKDALYNIIYDINYMCKYLYCTHYKIQNGKQHVSRKPTFKDGGCFSATQLPFHNKKIIFYTSGLLTNLTMHAWLQYNNYPQTLTNMTVLRT